MFYNSCNYKSNLEKEFESLCQTNGWNILFNRIKNRSSFETMNCECTVSRSTENRFRNKYREIVPYDFNRVLIPKCEFSNSYINASMVKVNERTYIVTQYPYSTYDLFWLMIWEFKSPGIISLGKFGNSDSDLYFPKNEKKLYIYSKETQKLIFVISLTNDHSNNGFYQRELQIYNVEMDSYHSLWHFEFWSWPDQMGPKCMLSFLNFLGVVRQLNILDAPDKPSIIHCSAGAGRSGTFCLIDLAILEMEKSGHVDGSEISDLIGRLRSQRMGMVHSICQLKFCYEALIEAHKRYRNNENKYFNGSYLLYNEFDQVNNNELKYSSSSDSSTSEIVYYKSSERDDEDSDFSNEMEPCDFSSRDMLDLSANEINLSNIRDSPTTSKELTNEYLWSFSKDISLREKIIAQRKLKNQKKIDVLSKHLKENNLTRFKVDSNTKFLKIRSLVEKISDHSYWPMVLIGGTIISMGAYMWFKYNIFK